MGKEKFTRGLDVGKATTIRGSLTVTGSLGVAGGIPSTAIQSIALTGVSTAAAGTPIAKGTRVALITSTGTGAGHEVKLSTGRSVGDEVTVAVAANSTVGTVVLLETTAQTIFGTTLNAVQFTKFSSGDTVRLVKASASQYLALWGGAPAAGGLGSTLSTKAPTAVASTGTV